MTSIAFTTGCYRLAAEGYDAVDRFSGGGLADLPPFSGLTLDPATLWPSF